MTIDDTYKNKLKKLYIAMKARNYSNEYITLILAYYVTYGDAFRRTVDMWVKAKHPADIRELSNEIMELVSYYKTETRYIN